MCLVDPHWVWDPQQPPTPGKFLSRLLVLANSHCVSLTSLVLAGVRGVGDCADQLHRGHRLPVCPAPHPPNILSATALLALLLQPLESDPYRLPLLPGHHHSTWISTPGGSPRACGRDRAAGCGSRPQEWGGGAPWYLLRYKTVLPPLS